MTPPEKFKSDILYSLELSLRSTETKNLKELDRTLCQVKKQKFDDFLQNVVSKLPPEERKRVKRFLLARKSYLDMVKESY